MAIVSMANAVAGTPASSAEYNKVVANVLDLDGRVTTAQSTANAATTTANTASTTANTANTTASGAVSVNTTQNGRLDTAETVRATGGRWVNTSASVNVAADSKAPFPTARTTPSGITVANNNTFTVTAAGRYDVSANVHFGASAGTSVWAWIGPGGTPNPRYALNIMSIAADGWYAFALSAMNLTLSAGASLSVYCWYSGAGNVTVLNPGADGATNTREATNFAIQRIG